MKRDFQEEYQNYIESDMPDLWSRIEPNLKEKNIEKESDRQENDGQKGKVLYFVKRAVPVAACLCAAVIGVGVMRTSKNNSAGEGMAEYASEAPTDAGVEYDAEPEVMEEAAAEEEPAMWDEAYDDACDEAVSDESAAPSEAFVEEAEETAGMDEEALEMPEAGNGEYEKPINGTKVHEIEASEEAVTIEWAKLSKIAVAPEEMQEEGYAYVYTFRLEDNSRLIVYLTNEQCKDLEEREVEIERQAAYTLSVFPIKAGDNTKDTTVGESFLENLEKLP